MKIKHGERVVTAYAEHVNGPGWANNPLWVIIRGTDGKLREECLQPEEQTLEILTLFDVSAELNKALVNAVQNAYDNKPQPTPPTQEVSPDGSVSLRRRNSENH